MTHSITCLEHHFDQLLSVIFSKSGVEGAAYLLCGKSQTPEEIRLLVQEVIPVKDEHYLLRTASRLSISSDSFVPVAKRAHDRNLSILFVHSHPQDVEDFSLQDDIEEPRLMEFFNKKAPNGTHGAVVVSSPIALSARILYDGEYSRFSRIRVIGRRFRFFDSKNLSDTPLPIFFDRQVIAFGPEVQRLLRGIHVGIVGLGGTGSAVFEQLVRLGVGKISIFDHDSFDDTNVNRVYGSSTQDSGRSKVDIAEESARHIELGTLIQKYPKGISYENSAKALRNCEVIFSCTDKEAPRGILTQLSIRYLIPLFDMGAKIDSHEGSIRGIYGRVTTFFPTEACLFCRERISAETIRLEGLTIHERESLAHEGYAPELDTSAPSVVMFTTAVATQAVMEFLHRFTGFMGEHRHTTEVVFHFHETKIGKNREKPKETCVCSQIELRGRGDSRYFLNLSWPIETTHPPT